MTCLMLSALTSAKLQPTAIVVGWRTVSAGVLRLDQFRNDIQLLTVPLDSIGVLELRA